MKVLLDTNVIVGLFEKARRSQVAHAIRGVREQGHNMYVIPQVIYEFWVVATRPIHGNGLGLPAETVAGKVEGILQTFDFVDDGGGIYQKWIGLVKSYNVSGKKAHDARIVAAMQVHQMEAIMTSNSRDFGPLSALVTIINPG
jgi:predicted nucleic acid-binding protein